MSNMFDNYPQPADYIPNNRPKPHCHKGLEIMAGESASHSFEIPFNVAEETTSCSVIYKLGIKDVIIKTMNELEFTSYDSEENCSIVTAKLSSDETLLFANTLLACKVQVMFILKDGSTIFTEIYPVKLVDSLIVEEK